MSRLGPLREREFRLLFAGQATSRLGSAMAPIALAFAVLNTLHGSATDLGLVLAARQATIVALLLFGGVWADRLPRHQVMVVSNLLSAASQATTSEISCDDIGLPGMSLRQSGAPKSGRPTITSVRSSWSGSNARKDPSTIELPFGPPLPPAP